MAARPRIRRRANWPENLHEPRPGYYTWRDPRDGKTHVLGRMALAQAIHEAQEANMVAGSGKLGKTLAERLMTPTQTVADLIKRMPTEGLKASTLTTRSYIDAAIVNGIGPVPCVDITTKHIADLIEPLIEQGKKRWAQSIRNRLMSICRRGMSLGWMTTNPVTDTERPKPKTKRRRLKLDEFQAIFEKAPEEIGRAHV